MTIPCTWSLTWCRALIYRFHFAFQATIMVYQAVAEYWANSKEPEYDVSVDILMPGRSSPEKYKVNRNNHYTTRTTKVKTYGLGWMPDPSLFFPFHLIHVHFFSFSGEYHKSECDSDSDRVRRSNSKSKTVMAASPYPQVQLHKSDAISSICQMVSLYYALPKEKASDCQKFDMKVQLIPGKAALPPFAFLVFWKKKGLNVDRTCLHLQIKWMRMRKCTSWE